MDNKNTLTSKTKMFLTELLFPSFCLGCKKEKTFLCDDCKSTLEISQFTYCLCNKNPMRLPPSQVENGKCQRCQNKKLSGLYSTLPYQEKFLTKKLIYQFKYQPYLKSLAKDLAGIVVEHFILIGKNTDAIWQDSALVPVPMEIKKQKKRGYNQAEQLAQELSKIINVPVLAHALVKTKKTAAQMQLSAKDRKENVKNAFLVKDFEKIKNKKIFLVDDVYTTGSTMEECARMLKEAGAKQVWGIAIAREG